jgi:hypothetical protein
MLSVIHIFVFAGILIWGGAIDVEALLEHEELTPLYGKSMQYLAQVYVIGVIG